MASVLYQAAASTTVPSSTTQAPPPPRQPQPPTNLIPPCHSHHNRPATLSLQTATAVALTTILTAAPSPSLAGDSPLLPTDSTMARPPAPPATGVTVGTPARRTRPSTLTRCLTGGRKGRCPRWITNGTDSEFYNPRKRSKKEYLTFLSGFRQLAPKDAVLNNLALADVDLQDLIAGADSISSREWKDDKGQVFYVYKIDGTGAHSLISVTCAKNKLYAHFVNAPTPEWNRDQETLRHIHESFMTVGY